MLLADGEADAPKSFNVFKNKLLNTDRLKKLFKRYPYVPEVGDMSITVNFILQRAPHYVPESSWGQDLNSPKIKELYVGERSLAKSEATSRSNTRRAPLGPFEHSVGGTMWCKAISTSGGNDYSKRERKREAKRRSLSLPRRFFIGLVANHHPYRYMLGNSWPDFRENHLSWTTNFVSAVNIISDTKFEKDPRHAAFCGDVYYIVLGGLRLIRDMTCAVIEQSTWKLTHPCTDADLDVIFKKEPVKSKRSKSVSSEEDTHAGYPDVSDYEVRRRASEASGS